MSRNSILWAGVAVLALAILSVTASSSRSAADEDKVVVPKDIADAVKKMADDAAKGGSLKKDSEAFAKKHPDDLKKTMWVFKPRMANGEGGFGVGKPGAFMPDGIEGIIISYGNPRRKAMTATELKTAAPDLERLADITLAMAELTYQYTPKKKEAGKDPKDWTKSTDDMKKGAQDLKAAIKANKPDDVKKAFTSLYSSCNSCHTVFRD
jgi:cytochrome c556